MSGMAAGSYRVHELRVLVFMNGTDIHFYKTTKTGGLGFCNLRRAAPGRGRGPRTVGARVRNTQLPILAQRTTPRGSWPGLCVACRANIPQPPGSSNSPCTRFVDGHNRAMHSHARLRGFSLVPRARVPRMRVLRLLPLMSRPPARLGAGGLPSALP